MLTDVQIAQNAKMEPIKEIAKKVGLEEDDLELPPRKCVPRYPVIKGRGSICSRKSPPLKPLTTGFFGLSRLRRRNKNLQFSPRPLRQYNPKTAPRRLFLFIAPNPWTSVSASLGSAAASPSACAA